MPNVSIRPATAADAEAVLALITELAAYEKLTPPDEAARGRIRAAMALDEPPFWTIVAESGGHPVGYAMCVQMYSTFSGKPKLFLEDLYVQPHVRGSGAGFALFQACAREAVRRDCSAMAWEVLDWNQPSIDFYERLGARFQKTWLPYRIERADIEKLLPR